MVKISTKKSKNLDLRWYFLSPIKAIRFLTHFRKKYVFVRFKLECENLNKTAVIPVLDQPVASYAVPPSTPSHEACRAVLM